MSSLIVKLVGLITKTSLLIAYHLIADKYNVGFSSEAIVFIKFTGQGLKTSSWMLCNFLHNVPASIKCKRIYSTVALKCCLCGQTCRPRIVVAQSSEGNRICLFRHRSDVQISDMYPIKIHIWKWPRSDAKKLNLVQYFVFRRVQQIPICVRCEQKIGCFVPV